MTITNAAGALMPHPAEQELTLDSTRDLMASLQQVQEGSISQHQEFLLQHPTLSPSKVEKYV
jgi:hypothetical protein